MKLRSTIVYALIALAVVAGVAVAAYRMGSRQSRAEMAALQDDMDRLVESEKDAAIVKRVSQQMEDIAYQQKAISDQQRDRAEEQSILATHNAERAERERIAAQEAESKATAAALVAERERANAERQQEIAQEQRDEATHSRNVADTLNRRTQAKSLGTTSQVRREAKEPEVADLLAYASWYFLKNNRGNQYFSETFKALALATGGIPRHKVKENGAVNALSKVPGHPGQCVAVTNYGEVEWLTAVGSDDARRISSKPLLFNPAYDFRDVTVVNKKIYALSLKGPLCVLDFTGHMDPVDLPEDDNYFKLVQTKGRLLVAGRRSLNWYANGKVSQDVTLDKTLSAIVDRDGTVCLFFADGSYAEMNAAGGIEEKKPLVQAVVTAAFYDPATECLLLGTEDGTVYPLNRYGRVMETLSAHKSKCMSITMLNPIVVTGGYDKNVFIWNMENLSFDSGLSFQEELEQESVTKRVASSQEIPAEWLVPVDYSFDGWTLAVCGDDDGKSVWIGTSAGNVMLLNASADDMAQQLYGKLKRNLTQQEWTRYVGVSIPYMKFK